MNAVCRAFVSYCNLVIQILLLQCCLSIEHREAIKLPYWTDYKSPKPLIIVNNLTTVAEVRRFMTFQCIACPVHQSSRCLFIAKIIFQAWWTKIFRFFPIFHGFNLDAELKGKFDFGVLLMYMPEWYICMGWFIWINNQQWASPFILTRLSRLCLKSGLSC